MVSEEKRKASRPTSVCQVLGQGTVFCRKNSRSKPSRAERKWAIAADEPDSNNAKSAESSEGKEGDAAGTGVAGQELCLLNGVAASLGSGVLGWVIGFGSNIVRLKVKGKRFQTSIQKANASSKTFGLMGGVYTFMACASRKIRGKDDAINLAIAGCASGVALGWDGGPVSAVQSCVGMGAFSWFFDGQRLKQVE